MSKKQLRNCLAISLPAIVFTIMILNGTIYEFYLNLSQKDNINLAYHKEDNKYFNTVKKYIIVEKSDFKNVYFTMLNNRRNTLTFVCSKEYKSCSSDFEDSLRDEKMMAALNDYIHPFNQYKTVAYTIDGQKIKLTVKYLYSDNDIKRIRNKMERLKLNTTEDINDYIRHYVTYKLGDNSVLSIVNRKEGNCKAITDFVNIALYDIGSMSYTISNNLHAWNVVIENGEKYHIDSTWNINANNYYFKLTTSELAALHEPEHSIPDIYREF